MFESALLQTDWPASGTDASLIAIGGVLCLRSPPGRLEGVAAGHAGHDAGHQNHGSHAPASAEHGESTSAETRYFDAGAEPCKLDDAGYATRVAAGFVSGRLSVDGILSTFDGEYGFINKLLPVIRVVRANGERLYVHLDSATIAAKINSADYVEGWVFANLHKWHALEVIGRWPRDILMILFALGIAASAAMGLVLFARQPR